MPIEGAIKELGVFELLQLLSFTQKSGKLKIMNPFGKVIKIFYFKNGSLSYVDLKETILDNLERSGKITKEDRDEFDGDNFPENIINKGILSREDFINMVRKYSEDAVYSIFKIKDGTFIFEECTVNTPFDIDLGYKIENLIMEGARRIDEMVKISSMIPSYNIVLEISSEIEEKKYVHLTPKEWMLLSHINGEYSIEDIIKISGDEFDTVKTLYGMMMAGLVKKKAVKNTKEKVEEHKWENVIDDFYEKGNYKEGIDYLIELGKKEPENPAIPYQLGFFYLKMGKFKMAISQWSEFLTRSPTGNKAKYVSELVEALRKVEKLIIRRDEVKNG